MTCENKAIVKARWETPVLHMADVNAAATKSQTNSDNNGNTNGTNS